jgi:hypothetical protein
MGEDEVDESGQVRGRPLPGATARSVADRDGYPKGVKVEDDEMAALKIRPHKFHGEWIYTISPPTLN